MTTSSTTEQLAARLGLKGLSQLPANDQDAIIATLGNLFDGFRERNTHKLTAVYAKDADWVNAFGSVKKGSDTILNYLRGLFEDGNFDQGKLAGAPSSQLRVVDDNVVIVSTHLQVTGQGLLDGGTIPIRDNHSLRVLQRQPDGAWTIISEMYMDSRQDESYINHS